MEIEKRMDIFLFRVPAIKGAWVAPKQETSPTFSQTCSV